MKMLKELLLKLYNFLFNKNPKAIYKYRVWSKEFHRNALTNNEIFFSSPSNLNDPYDCKIPLKFTRSKKKELKESIKYFKKNSSRII